MKDDLNASEKRLIAALDRIDLVIDRAAAPTAPSPDRTQALAEAETRLAEAEAQAARLAEANAALTAANAALIAGQPGAAEIRQAYEAELMALRAARAAEIGQVGAILGTLDRLLADPAPDPAPPAMVESPMPTRPASAETASARAESAGAARDDRG